MARDLFEMEIAGLLNDRLPGIFLPLIQFPAIGSSERDAMSIFEVAAGCQEKGTHQSSFIRK
jgi:hypothetical protein